MKVLDYIIIAAVLIWLIIVIVWMIRRKKQGKTICCGNCSGCSANCRQRAS